MLSGHEDLMLRAAMDKVAIDNFSGQSHHRLLKYCLRPLSLTLSANTYPSFCMNVIGLYHLGQFLLV